MKEYPSIKNAKLDEKHIQRIKDSFKWSGFTEGVTYTHVTPSGGIHYTGKLVKTKAVFFELKKKNSYIGILLYEYPKGVVFHVYFPYPKVLDMSKTEMDFMIEPIYQKIIELLTK